MRSRRSLSHFDICTFIQVDVADPIRVTHYGDFCLVFHTLHQRMQSLSAGKLPPALIQAVSTRGEISALLAQEKYIDLVREA
jgi:hypothetical protein